MNNKTFVRILGLCLMICSAVGARAASGISFDDYATVVSVEPNIVQTNSRQRVCEDVVVGSRKGNSMTGTVIGGVAGGIIGNQVGGGNGKTAATAVGTLIGGMIGNNMGSTDEQPVTQTRCNYVNQPASAQNGYLVTYSYQGRTGQVVSSRDPGPQIRLVVSAQPR